MNRKDEKQRAVSAAVRAEAALFACQLPEQNLALNS